MQRFELKDSGQTLSFTGQVLAMASSKDNEPRWSDYTLYKTIGGNYIVERTGRSIAFHQHSCYIVDRNKLSAVDPEFIPLSFVPCEKCKPSRIDPEGLFPERDRTKLLRCENAEGAVRSLEMKDRVSGNLYLTNVAKRLLDEAATHDPELYRAYKVIEID